MYILMYVSAHLCVQNLTILLSKLKTSYEEIKVLVLQMDEEEIPRDMLEQVCALFYITPCTQYPVR